MTGVHPTRCNDFLNDPNGPEYHFTQLLELAKEGKENGNVIAIGEIGLDFDRLEVQ